MRPTGGGGAGSDMSTDQITRKELKRVDTSAWETAQTGVVYYAPDQYGGYFGNVLRQYWAGTGVTGDVTLIASGVAKVLGQGGYGSDPTYSNLVQCGSLFTPNTYLTVMINNSTGELFLSRGIYMDDASDSYAVFADYVLT